MKYRAALLALLLFFSPSFVWAHFGMVIPDAPSLLNGAHPQLELELSFSHPFDGVGMPLEKPASFAVYSSGKKKDLLPLLEPKKVMGKAGWLASLKVSRPGVYQFVMTPKPYWEPAEDLFIVHTTKTIVPAFGAEAGWDEELGLETEIVSLTRPFGLYAGNLFQGVVKLKGEAVAGAEVEIEHYNRGKKREAASAYHVTQVVKADENGVFSFVAPAPGWWGFSALNEADIELEHGGQKKKVELGAVLWVSFSDWEK